MNLERETVYLDTSAVIYVLEGVGQFNGLRDQLLPLLDLGEITVHTSELTLLEACVGPRRRGDAEAERTIRAFLVPSASLRVAPVTRSVLDDAVGLRAVYGLRTPDAIHIATGLQQRCTVFLTGDTAWKRVGIRAVTPAELE